MDTYLLEINPAELASDALWKGCKQWICEAVSSVYWLLGRGVQQCTVLSIFMREQGCGMPYIWINLKHAIYGFESCCKFTPVFCIEVICIFKQETVCISWADHCDILSVLEAVWHKGIMATGVLLMVFSSCGHCGQQWNPGCGVIMVLGLFHWL